MSSLFGEEIRLGRHDCYDRFVLQLQGSGEMPGWSVGYRDPLISDPAGDVVDLQGGASMEVMVRAWAVVPYQGIPEEWLPFDGPTQILPDGFTAIQEVRYIAAFEGSTQFGIGVDRQRPFRAFALAEPPRLVVDIAHQ